MNNKTIKKKTGINVPLNSYLLKIFFSLIWKKDNILKVIVKLSEMYSEALCKQGRPEQTLFFLHRLEQPVLRLCINGISALCALLYKNFSLKIMFLRFIYVIHLLVVRQPSNRKKTNKLNPC
jgi:hypothetical protein